MERDLYQEAMAFIARRGELQSIQGLNETFLALVAPHGVEHFACAEIYSPRGQAKVGLIFGSPGEGFLKDYVRTESFRHDPMLREALIARQPFAWSDVLARDDLSLEAKAVMDLARAWSRNSGFVVPIHRVDGTIASVVLSGTEIDLSPVVRGFLQLISRYFHDLGLALANLREAPPEPERLLSGVQLACLRGLARGLDEAEIALSEGIRLETVRTEIAAAQAILEADTPARAVFAAIKRKELALP